MKILLISRFNVPNIGDLAISNMLYKFLCKYGEVTRYNLFGSPYNFIDINKVEKNNNTFKLKIIQILKKYNLYKLLNIYSNIMKKYRVSKKGNEFRFENVLEKNDLLIIGGGNMLMTLSELNDNLLNFQEYIKIANNYDKPIFIMDIGIGPFYNEEHAKLAIEALNLCDKITFRDQQSYDLFVNNGGDSEKASVSLDTAFMYEYDMESLNRGGFKNRVAINIMDSRHILNKNHLYNDKIKAYATIIDKLVQKDIEVVLFTSSKEDQLALEDVYKKVNNKTKVNKKCVNGLDDIIEIYQDVDILLGTRMHSMIIGFTMGVPVIGLSWQPKITALFNTFEQTSNLLQFDKIETETDKIYQLCLENLNMIDEKKIEINEKLEKIKKRANINDVILNNFSDIYPN